MDPCKCQGFVLFHSLCSWESAFFEAYGTKKLALMLQLYQVLLLSPRVPTSPDLRVHISMHPQSDGKIPDLALDLGIQHTKLQHNLLVNSDITLLVTR